MTIELINYKTLPYQYLDELKATDYFTLDEAKALLHLANVTQIILAGAWALANQGKTEQAVEIEQAFFNEITELAKRCRKRIDAAEEAE